MLRIKFKVLHMRGKHFITELMSLALCVHFFHVDYLEQNLKLRKSSSVSDPSWNVNWDILKINIFLSWCRLT